MLENLKHAHFSKIDMNDIIYVVDVNGYIGNSIKQEIEYAKIHQNEVVFYSKSVL